MNKVHDSEILNILIIHPCFHTRLKIKSNNGFYLFSFQDEKIQNIEEMKTMIPPDSEEIKNNIH